MTRGQGQVNYLRGRTINVIHTLPQLIYPINFDNWQKRYTYRNVKENYDGWCDGKESCLDKIESSRRMRKQFGIS